LVDGGPNHYRALGCQKPGLTLPGFVLSRLRRDWYPEKPILFLSDPVGEHQPDIVFVGLVHNGLRTQSAFLFGFFLSQDVVLVGPFPFDFSGPCHFEALLRT
jgi:hypothetical protein